MSVQLVSQWAVHLWKIRLLLCRISHGDFCCLECPHISPPPPCVLFFYICTCTCTPKKVPVSDLIIANICELWETQNFEKTIVQIFCLASCPWFWFLMHILTCYLGSHFITFDVYIFLYLERWSYSAMYHTVHCKKSLSFLPSPAGTSLTKLSLAGNY